MLRIMPVVSLRTTEPLCGKRCCLALFEGQGLLRGIYLPGADISANTERRVKYIYI